MTGFYSYLLRCSDGSLYSGYTVDIRRRLAAHNAGKGGHYTAARRPVRLAALWRWPDRHWAMRAEFLVKRLERAEKLELVRAPARMADIAGAGPLECFSSQKLRELNKDRL